VQAMRHATAQRKEKEDNSSGAIAAQAVAVMTAAMAASASAGRDKEIGGGGKEGVLTWFSWGCVRANGYLLTYFALCIAGEAR
jgi:hypothetical protein